MTIRHRQRFEQWLPAGFDGEFDWDFLRSAFAGTKIEPMDIDACVERNGQILLFETKAPGTPIQRGQQITLTTHWKNGASIIYIEGKNAPTITGCAVYAAEKYRAGMEFGCITARAATYIDVAYFTRRWFCRASGLAVPAFDEWKREIWLEDFDAHTDQDDLWTPPKHDLVDAR